MESKDFINEMLNVADAIVAAGSSVLPVKSLRYWYINAHSIGMNYIRNNLGGMNSYQSSGKIVGDTLTLFGVGKVASIISKGSIGLNVSINASGSYIVNHYSPLGDYMSNIYDTYVRNADEFYTRLANDKEYRKEVMDATKELIPTFSELNDYYGNITPEQFWEDLKYAFGKPPSSNEGSLVYNVKINSKKHNVEVIDTNKVKKDEIEKSIIEEIVKHDEIKTITLNSQTYNIQQLSNLELRNAIDYIPKVSFLLSNILIKAGETIDLGTKGLYKVKSGDTLSTIAQNNKLITKDLLKLNPHLIDNGRVKFLQNKVLISVDPRILHNKNHVLQGDFSAENLLIDSNGGDNIFIGGNKKDIMKSTKDGYDIYQVSNKDEITDNDGKGKVIFNNTTLTGGTYDKEKDCYVNGDIEYHLNGKILTIKQGKESLTIKNFNKDNNDLGITLLDQGEISITISDNEKAEGNNGEQSMNFNIKVNGEIPKGEYAIININGQEYLIGTPNPKYNIDTSKYKRTLTYTHKWQGNEKKKKIKNL